MSFVLVCLILSWINFAVLTCTARTLQVENAMLQLKQSRLQAEMNEMMLFYEEDKQVTDDEILGLKNVVCRNY